MQHIEEINLLYSVAVSELTAQGAVPTMTQLEALLARFGPTARVAHTTTAVRPLEDRPQI